MGKYDVSTWQCIGGRDEHEVVDIDALGQALKDIDARLAVLEGRGVDGGARAISIGYGLNLLPEQVETLSSLPSRGLLEEYANRTYPQNYRTCAWRELVRRLDEAEAASGDKRPGGVLATLDAYRAQNIDYYNEVAKLKAENAELLRRLAPTQRQKVAEAFLHAALKSVATDAEMPYQQIADMIRIGIDGDSILANDMACVLEAAQDSPDA